MESTAPGPVVEQPLAVSYQVESLLQLWGEAQSLLRAHAAEVGCLPGLELQPDVDAYGRGAESGYLRAFAMRGHRAELVGYCAMGVSRHLHWSQTVWAIQDVLYVVPEHRGIAAVDFIRWMDAHLFREVNVIARHVTLLNDFGRTLERMGYREIEKTYVLVRGS